ncbi:putative polysaccharide biosynthesis protein [Texcoconibacillus texcoconensis]|uniref:O-antigen/teichoic acid export membrane protein n=1 Tax=Texcoconibacillus texcoconensis TaxID=1095777 RepID=A0A840QN62_9BACI|nr:polysaccharide biosynthesis protein [Texcoconibacillus texcoconensis]MBB5172809.1 O-antigen/teichoic acid export membrane protein [Texcoconibacillus texcoconensis]
MSNNQLVRGTMILTAAIFISKTLGLLYIFPFQAIVGLDGLALYNYGYTPYTVLLSLATLGIPLAVSKFVSKYQALGDFRTGQRLFHSGLLVMTVTGFFAFLLLFLLAEPIARQVIDPNNMEGNDLADVVFTIRMVSVALLIVPIMSIVRGYFQGFQSMGPTAVSQVVEQLVRIVFILTAAYLIIHIFEGELGVAVGFATFGAFIGALGGLVVLFIFWWRRRNAISVQIEQSEVDHRLPLKQMYKELIAYALPISFVGLAIPMFQMVDLFTFNQAMMDIGFGQNEAERYFGAFTSASHKLILIPVSVATAMSLTILPALTKSYTHGDHEGLKKQVTQTFQIILFISVPAGIGLFLLADPAYATLFGLDDLEIGGDILQYYAPVAILFSVFPVSAALLQGIDKQRYAVIALTVGVLLKALLNTLLISWLGATGAIFATAIGYLAAIAITIWAISKYTSYNYVFLLKRSLLIVMFTFAMAVVVILTNRLLQQWFPLESWGNSLISLAVPVVVGTLTYFLLTVRSGLAGDVLGHRFRFLNKKRPLQQKE